MCFHKKAAGFTLIELLVTIVVISIIAAIAVPSFRNIILSNSVSFDRDELFVALNYARSEAIKRGAAVTVCKSADGTSCDNSLAWNAGWLIFQDDNRNGARAASEGLLRSFPALDSQVGLAHSASANRVTFESRGLLLGGNGAGQFTFSHSAGADYNRSIDVSATGRATKGT